jgi:RNA polymerase sigma-70 factor (ECF subfamily)
MSHDAQASLDPARAGDLALARAAAAGDPRAIGEFLTAFRPEIERIARRVAVPGQSPDDAVQIVTQRLLVASEGGQPRIADYDGRGALRGWVRVTALRALLDAARQAARLRHERPLDDEGPVAAGDDPEMEMLRRKYTLEFRAAFAVAAASMTARERNLLRHHFVEALGIDAIAELYRVHRATAARWLARARRTLVAATRKELARRVSASRTELRSVMRLVDSQLPMSLSRVFAAAEE